MILTEFLIFDCHLECRKYKHYHCCHCPTTIINKADFIKHINVCKHSALQVNHTVPSATQWIEMTPQVNHTVPSATRYVEMTPQVNHTVPSAIQCVEMTPQVNHTVPSATQCVEMTPEVNHSVPSATQWIEMTPQVNHTVPSATQCVEMTPQVNHTVPSATQCGEMTPQVNHTVPSATQCVEMTPQVNHTVPSATRCVEMTPQVNHTVPSATRCVEMTLQVNHTVPSASQCVEMTPQVNHTVSSASQCVKTSKNGLKSVRRKQEQRLTCPHCHQCVLKKNLKKHIQRAHTDIEHDITAQSHLQSQCIDPKNGVFAVAKSSKGPCIPIHVIKKTWGSSHNVTCELDVCSAVVNFKRRSGMRSCQCAHLQSVDYCRSDAGNVVLDEDVLKEMVQHKWFSEERKRQCLNSQKKAEEQDMCFASYVNLGGPSYMHYVSVFEPNVSFYNRLGRIMVVYNAKLNTWHCPCTRPRRSCIHKAVCKWHLFQTNRKLFQRVKSTEEDLTCKTSLQVDTCLSLEKDDAENTVYPPTNEDLKKMVQYIFTNKTIPSSLPISTTDLNEK